MQKFESVAARLLSNQVAEEQLAKPSTNTPKTSNEYENKDKQERSFNKISLAFNAITGKDITPAEVALLLQVVKMVRQCSNDRYHQDSCEDMVSYASLTAELWYEQYKDESKT